MSLVDYASSSDEDEQQQQPSLPPINQPSVSSSNQWAGKRDSEEAGLEWVGPPHSTHAVKFPKEGPCIIRRRSNIVTEDISKLFVKRPAEPSSQ